VESGPVWSVLKLLSHKALDRNADKSISSSEYWVRDAYKNICVYKRLLVCFKYMFDLIKFTFLFFSCFSKY
jgi:hypothetical protein